jgi:flagellin
MIINTNVASLNAQAALTSNQTNLQKAMQELSTGQRINNASDDPAGSSISNLFQAQIVGLNQAVRNANDGINYATTAEGAANQIVNMLQRMREIAVQTANQTYSSSDITNAQTELHQLQTEITRVANATTWNGITMLAGAGANAKGRTLQIGSDGDSGNSITITAGTLTAAILKVDASATGITIDNNADAQSAIVNITKAIQTVSTTAAKLGAAVNRLQFTINTLTTQSTNLSASKSSISDTDYSQASSALAKAQVIQQAGTAMLAQANQSSQLVLALLK